MSTLPKTLPGPPAPSDAPRVTRNEVARQVFKAAQGAGLPTGLCEEAAEGAAWLEAHGLDGIKAFLAALEGLAGDPEAWRLEAPDDTLAIPERLDAAGRSAVFLAGPLWDLTRAGADRLEVTNLRHPQYLLPYAALATRRGAALAVEVTQDGRKAGAQIVQGQTRPDGDWSRFSAAPCTATLTLGTPAEATAELPPFETAAADRLRQGLDVDPTPWTALAPLAHKALVPATAESRLKGAGVADRERE